MKLIFIDLLFYSETEIFSAKELYNIHISNLGYAKHLPKNISTTIIQHCGCNDKLDINGNSFIVLKKTNRKWNPYLQLLLEIRKLKPDIVLVHSMIYAWQCIIIRLILGSETKIIVQNHAEKPFGYKKIWLQRLASRYISAYLFASTEQALPWIEKKIIRNRDKIHEVMEGSTSFVVKDKNLLGEKFKSKDQTIFIWVGRLDLNKDPVTILRAFASYIKHNSNAKLWMVYSSVDLLKEISEFIKVNNMFSFIEMLGYVEHNSLEEYYNAADYFILGSHYEGSGYALCEAMACGCVPIVTNIPSFRAMLNNGECGYLFEPGNSKELTKILTKLNLKDQSLYREKVLEKFNNDLSFNAIANRISEIINNLVQK